jgi:hypothetical protein
MRDNLDELLTGVYHRGESVSEELNKAVLQKVREKDRFSSKGNFRKYAMAAAILAATLLLGTGGVYAAMKTFGLEYFWSQNNRSEMPQEVKDLIDTEPEVTVQNQSKRQDILEYQATSVLCDSKYVAVTVEVSVKDVKKYGLIVDSISADADTDYEKSALEYCRKNSLQPVQIQMRLSNKSEENLHIVTTYSDQTDTTGATFVICAKRFSDEKYFTMDIMPLVFLGEDGEDQTSYKDEVLQVEVSNQSSEQSAAYIVDDEEEYAVPGTSITLEEITLTTTEIGTYFKAVYKDTSNSDDATEDWLGLCDADGSPLEMGMMAGGKSSSIGENEYTDEICYKNIGLPDTIYLSIGDGYKVIPMKKK